MAKENFDGIFSLIELARWMAAPNMAFALHHNCYGVTPFTAEEKMEIAEEIRNRRAKIARHLKIADNPQIDTKKFILTAARILFGSAIDMPADQQRTISTMPEILWMSQTKRAR